MIGALRQHPRSRRGLSILEVMVVIAIMLALAAVLAPAARSVFQLDQRAAARKLAIAFERLQDEAVMRNLTFRVVFYLDQDRYVIESGEPGALIAASPDERADFEQELKDKMRHMDDAQKRAFLRARRQPFESLGQSGKMEVKLPAGVKLGGVYTPQYGHMVRPGEALEGASEDDKSTKVFSYVMNSGFSEHTLIWLVPHADADEGWTVEVEPLSGVVHLHGELVEVYDLREGIPDEGPSLPN